MKAKRTSKLKRARTERAKPSSVQRVVQRQRRCQWLTELKGWNDCGDIATHVRPDCGLTYCAKHAAYFGRYCHLEALPPNAPGERPGQEARELKP